MSGRVLYKDLSAVVVGEELLGKGSYIPYGINADRNEKYVEEFYSFLIKMKELVTHHSSELNERVMTTHQVPSYRLMAFGDPSISKKVDVENFDALFEKVKERVGVSVEPLYRTYPHSDYDPFAHPTREGALVIAQALFEQITSSPFDTRLLSQIRASIYERKQSIYAFIEDELHTTIVDSQSNVRG